MIRIWNCFFLVRQLVEHSSMAWGMCQGKCCWRRQSLLAASTLPPAKEYFSEMCSIPQDFFHYPRSLISLLKHFNLAVAVWLCCGWGRTRLTPVVVGFPPTHTVLIAVCHHEFCWVASHLGGGGEGPPTPRAPQPQGGPFQLLQFCDSVIHLYHWAKTETNLQANMSAINLSNTSSVKVMCVSSSN